MKQTAEQEAEANARARKCVELILQDQTLRVRWITARLGNQRFQEMEAAGFRHATDGFDAFAVTVANLHFMLSRPDEVKGRSPLYEAKARYEQRQTLDRAIKQFRAKVEAYERQAGESLPRLAAVFHPTAHEEGWAHELPDSTWRKIERHTLGDYLEVLADWLDFPGNKDDGNAGGSDTAKLRSDGLWVHRMLVTPEGQWPRTANAAACIWIIRSLDNFSIPRRDDRQLEEYLSLALMVAKVFQTSGPAVDIDVSKRALIDRLKLSDAADWVHY